MSRSAVLVMFGEFQGPKSVDFIIHRFQQPWVNVKNGTEEGGLKARRSKYWSSGTTDILFYFLALILLLRSTWTCSS